MTSNEYIYQNNLITPITPFSSDFVNSLTNNPDSSNLEEPVICKQQTQKKKLFAKKCFLKYFIYFIAILVFFSISAYIIYTSTLFLFELPNLKICSKDSRLYIYLFACIISGYLFSIGNFLSIFIIKYHEFALFSKLPKSSKAFFYLLDLISVFYGFTSIYNYNSYDEISKIYNKIYHGCEILLFIIYWIYMFILVGYLNDFKDNNSDN